jgi:vacuolar-type H+-ATPase subunit I/STV1
MLQDDPKRIIDYITYLKSQGVDYLRVKFTKSVEDKINILKNYYRTKSNITIETDFEQEQVRKEIQTLGDKYKEYDYLFDKNLSSNEILVRYMNQSEKTDYWTVDNLTQFLHDIEKL